MKTIRKMEDELFVEWKQQLSGLVRDGIVDESEYNNAKRKIVYVLKEVNSDDSTLDLRDFVAEGGRWQTWDNIARWTQGILDIEH